MATERVDQATWDQLRAAWSAYASAIEAWMQAATAGSADHEVDRLLHEVIAEHSSWSDALSRVVHATHHH